MCRTFRDWLALFLGVLVFPGLWVVEGLGYVTIPEIVTGATVSIETMIALFYFRKKEAD